MAMRGVIRGRRKHLRIQMIECLRERHSSRKPPGECKTPGCRDGVTNEFGQRNQRPDRIPDAIRRHREDRQRGDDRHRVRPASKGATRLSVSRYLRYKRPAGDQGEHQPLGISADDHESGRARGGRDRARGRGADRRTQKARTTRRRLEAGSGCRQRPERSRKSAVSRLLAAVAT